MPSFEVGDEAREEFDPVMLEWAKFYEQLSNGAIDPTGEHGGQFVAFAQGRVIDYGEDSVTLRRAVATRLGVHPESFVVSFLDNRF